MKRIYIAGPYSHGDIAVNVRNAMEAGLLIIKAGHAPYIPHLSHFLHMMQPQNYETWMGLDMEWIRQCNALWRLEGYSPGADREIRHANCLGIPIFSNFAKLLDWLAKA